MIAVFVFFWLPLSFAVAILANRYRRSALGWLLLSVVFSPLIGFAFVLASGPRVARPIIVEQAPQQPDAEPQQIDHGGITNPYFLQ